MDHLYYNLFLLVFYLTYNTWTIYITIFKRMCKSTDIKELWQPFKIDGGPVTGIPDDSRTVLAISGSDLGQISPNMLTRSYTLNKEYVARITCLYKNNGAVSCVRGNVLFICTKYFDTKLHGILPWADINGNCNSFLTLGADRKLLVGLRGGS